jgi:hypothetical protein
MANDSNVAVRVDAETRRTVPRMAASSFEFIIFPCRSF